jgi:hypothetical protein
MPYSIHLLLALATLPCGKSNASAGRTQKNAGELQDVIAPLLERLCQRVEQFCQQRVTPTEMHRFEQQLQEGLRELGRSIAQWAYNRLEPAVDALPKHVWFEAAPYTRLNQKTPQNAWTLFGQIRLWRVGYRPTNKTGDATLFPLALSLGLVHGATPALAECASRLLSGSGMTQKQTLERLLQDHGVGWGVKKLREVTGTVSRAMAEQRHDAQVEKLLKLLEQATASKGRHKPVLSMGRDGVTLGLRARGGRLFEVATTGTVTVFDRRGKRLGTVYLAYTPESGQGTMSLELTRLVREVLERWQGTLPRLCYVTDAGDNETSYYDEVLRRMKQHPRTGEPLDWVRVVDYYHASERIWKMAELLFGNGQRSAAWARKMQKWLLKPGGVNRVLHSAAALRELHGLQNKKLKEFQTAYRYLRDRMQYMRYAEYRALGIPRGSGVTEAACKTVYAQRLKLSGMSWKKPGAQTVLNLRVLQLSAVWDEAYAGVLSQQDEAKVAGQPKAKANRLTNAA